MNHSVAVTRTLDTLQHTAEQLAQRLQLPTTLPHATEYDYLLTLTPQRLELQSTRHPSWTPLFVDFLSANHQHRQQFGGGKNQLIAKAIGIKTAHRPTVWDVTAGLGNDGFVLASLGCSVTLFERSPIISALLSDGLHRAYQASLITPSQLHLIEGEATTLFCEREDQPKPEVIFCDPMFCPSKKSALVKKNMRIIRDIVGNDTDSPQLIHQALQHAQRRVVVKRARHAPILTQQQPDIQYRGQSCRYDVYLTHQ